MSGKTHTQAVPANSPSRGAKDGVSSQAHEGAPGGESAGAPYPNPHTGKPEAERDGVGGGLMGHGGQSGMGYHGAGQLGSRKTSPDGNPNAGAAEE